MLEKDIEKYFRHKLIDQGCLVFKFVSPGNVGVPDRVIISKTGKVYFVELKRPGGKIRKLQTTCIQKLKSHNVWAGVISTKAEVDDFCKLVIRNDRS